MAEQHYANGTNGAQQPSGAPAGDLRDRVAAAAEAQKNRAADGLGSVGDSVRQAGDHLRGSSAFVASWVNAVGDHLVTMADGLRDKEPGELMDDVTAFARRQPALFLGGAFLLGVGVAQVLRAGGGPGLAGAPFGSRGGRSPRAAGFAMDDAAATTDTAAF